MVQSVVTLTVAHPLLMFKEGLYRFLATSLRSIHRRSPATGVSPPRSSRCLLASATSPRAAARMRAVSPSEEDPPRQARRWLRRRCAWQVRLATFLPDCDQSTIADCPYDSPPATAARPRVPSAASAPRGGALRMCQPVQRLVGMGIHPAHRLLQCCAVDALTHRHRPDSGVNPLMLGRRGRHSYGSEQRTRGRAAIRAMLLRPASDRRILLCGPALLHPAGPQDP